MLERCFQELLDMPLNEFEPKPLPHGTYLCVVVQQPDFDRVCDEDAIDYEDETPCVVFTFKPVQVQNDVDQRELREVLNGETLSEREITYRIPAADRSKRWIKKFLVDDLGIDPTLQLKQAICEAMGRQVNVKLSHRVAKNGSAVYDFVVGTAKV